MDNEELNMKVKDENKLHYLKNEAHLISICP